MRRFAYAAAALAAAWTGSALAQGATYREGSVPSDTYRRDVNDPAPAPRASSRWGSDIDGRWYAGQRAPGGWNAYVRPERGWIVPSYWRSPEWAIEDWSVYGLQPPPAGFVWSRYYDDAILVDRRGYVLDSVGGIAWDGGYGARTVIEYHPPVVTTTTTTVTEEWVRPRPRSTPRRARRR